MIIVSDGRGFTDGVAHNFISQINSHIPIVLVSRIEGFKFNENLNQLIGKPYILFDFIELGWQWNQQEGHLWGVNTDKFDFLNDYSEFDEFVKNNPAALTFCRELLKKDESNILKPIEYPNFQPAHPVQSKEEFNQRPILFLNFWGRSHEARVQLHGEIWKNATHRNYSVCDNLYYFQNFMIEEKGKKAVSLWIPHYGRVDISNILHINSQSKLSISMPGNGIKCFRSTGESLVNSVCVMKQDNLAWSYPFIHNENCIKFNEFGEELNAIEEALNNQNLYDIYLSSLQLADKYRIDNYIKNYIEPLINEQL